MLSPEAKARIFDITANFGELGEQLAQDAGMTPADIAANLFVRMFGDNDTLTQLDGGAITFVDAIERTVKREQALTSEDGTPETKEVDGLMAVIKRTPDVSKWLEHYDSLSDEAKEVGELYVLVACGYFIDDAAITYPPLIAALAHGEASPGAAALCDLFVTEAKDANQLLWSAA